MKKALKWIMAVALLAGASSHGAALYYFGETESSWFATNNWSSTPTTPTPVGQLPTSGDQARILNAWAQAGVTVDGQGAVVGDLLVGLWGSGGSLTIEASGELASSKRFKLFSPVPAKPAVITNHGQLTTATGGELAPAVGGGEASFINHGTFSSPGVIYGTSGTCSISNTGSFACGGLNPGGPDLVSFTVYNTGTMSVGSLASTDGGTGVLNIHGGSFTAGNIRGMDLSVGSGFTIDIRNGGVLRIDGSSQADADELNHLHQTVGSITSDEPLFAVYDLRTDMTTLGPATALDLDPPTPNPAGFASTPIAISSSEIWMTAEGSDASGWIQYLFTETSGNPGGTDSGWQTSSSYTDGGLNPATSYSYTVTMRDAFGNTTTASPPVSATTAATDPDLGSLPELSGKSVAIWSKGAEQFVRSAGVDDGVLLADRASYEENDEGRFLCFAEAGDTIAIMDMMLSRYVTHTAGKLASAVSGDPAARRFTLVDQGSHYYAIQADNGKYVRVDGAGELIVDADAITVDALFAIVPIRTGPNVVVRAYNGDDPNDQLPTWPNEAANYCDHPDEFPVNKVNAGMLQLTAGLYSDQQLADLRAVWNTDAVECEFILPYSTTVNLTNQVDNLIGRIRKIEGAGFSFEYGILYHEILAGLPGGPWSDPRVSSQEEVDLFRSRVTEFYNAGQLNQPSYKLFCMPYQFASNSVMGFSAGGVPADTPVGCDAATLEFIKNNFDGMILEVNGHDYTQRDEDADAATAAVWCRDNGLEFGITSGGLDRKDTRFKGMFGDIFAEMATVGFDKSWGGMHYILHHAKTTYGNALPEWTDNTTTENAKWLIEQSMPFEAPSISAIDTDGDGIADLVEIRAGTSPLEVTGSGYDSWAATFSGIDLSDPVADFDGDGLDNLMEYALGGNPTNADAASVLPVFQPLENYFHYIHNERTDDSNLTYTVQLSTNLVSDAWKTNGVEFVGEAAFSNVWKTVTNQVPTLGKEQQFIRLKIEKE